MILNTPGIKLLSNQRHELIMGNLPIVRFLFSYNFTSVTKQSHLPFKHHAQIHTNQTCGLKKFTLAEMCVRKDVTSSPAEHLHFRETKYLLN